MRRLVPLALSATLLAACAPTQAHRARPGATPFTQYVAIGDSITAGFQSGGLTAASQRDAYPRLLGARGGLDVPMPEVNDPGCPPPIGVTGEKNCTRRDPAVRSPVVAIPGAKVGDVLRSTDRQVADPDPQLYDADLYRVILGTGTTQLGAALAQKPQFVTVWIGNNDVLLPTLRGRPDTSTPVAPFRADYRTLIERLRVSGVPHIVVMTVPDVTRVPALIPVRLLRLAGVVARDCDGQDVYFGSVVVGRATAAQPLSCASSEALTAAEFAQAQATVAQYNAVIREVAAEFQVPVFDVNAVLDRLPGRPLLPTAASPFGRSFSRDGVHPSSFAHARFAQALAVFMNEQFGTDLDVRAP
ncbi:SGNH/GDSL hydrolase family protein [Deinococcus maricopensis]|uniref:Lipolytic protein G-D-S-L family n=1 Tax=Deinococcus maricopensis (strain DSM 21211 / LMG 22137 / NRRL B-23946 / LB-34) TaxID=709986 RepID=E8U4B6_DEIML|nr:GDSL-type esterase/lipase family protein [Deinococcus maricopensis]ADV65953.1 lipolytic protein G-D-S-L family [Deinococcus maricopensis DSM 21211]